ncbi:NAD-dependent epimerase/dehydratase family protein [Pedobacter cryotolerans]|uniref:NAD-dependent epimerase/dehydratase family protein n=1 Tax=Pedobacter cryotolerans TaxID=2571270 RepID=A0A4U1CGI6_9SPHI|nr:NAD-dependent epimerase/dehydratase family protein [Pedobacter cryotolerans]TKC03501.1 NAD-dependent epimerase/dehydratase family protein [Pedobacter cryotolerans]
MKILLTGSSGFLGSVILDVLSNHADVISLSRKNANIIADLVDGTPKLPQVDLVIHCAGKAHSVPKTEVEKQAFFDVNVNGTANLLKGLEATPILPQSFVLISTVAVYGCETGTLINEGYPLNATDAYGVSKIQAEQLVKEWCAKHNIICSILRLPLLVGKNPPGNLGAMIKGIQKGYYFNIAGGKAKKSMVLTSDVAKIIPELAKIGGTYNLTDGYHPSFGKLAQLMGKQLGKARIKNMPYWLANVLGKAGNLLGNKSPINQNKVVKITSDLTFDDSKARKILNWKPNSVLEEFKIK